MEYSPVPGYEGYYSVSRVGEVRSEPRTVLTKNGQTRRYKGRPMSTSSPSRNYPYRTVSLNKDGVATTFNVHDLVARAFLGERLPGQVVRHLDGDHSNNSVDNLQYGTPSENTHDSIRHKTHYYGSRDRCKRGHLLLGENVKMRSQGDGRMCVSCTRATHAVARHPEWKPDFDEVADSYYQQISTFL